MNLRTIGYEASKMSFRERDLVAGREGEYSIGRFSVASLRKKNLQLR